MAGIATAPTLLPPLGAMVIPGTEPPRFCFDSKGWAQLQTYLRLTLPLPVTTAEFVALYGNFAGESEVAAVVAAMQVVQALSAGFGNPTALMNALAANPTLLQSPTPPAALYDNLVWTAWRVDNAADTFAQTLAQFQALLTPANCGSPTQCGQALIEVMTGGGGLESTATGVVAPVVLLAGALATFNAAMTGANAALRQYTASSSAFYKEAVAAAAAPGPGQQRAQQLVDTLGRLDPALADAGPASADFLATLVQLAAAWVTVSQNLAAVGETYTPDQLSQYAWVNQALKCGQAAQDWQTIGTAAQAYTQNALVPFPTGSIPN